MLSNWNKTFDCKWKKQALSVDGTVTVTIAPNNYVVAVWQLPAEEIYWTDSDSVDEHDSFTD